MADEKLPVPVYNDMHRLAKLAREVAWGMRELKDILADYNISEEQYGVLMENPFYKRALETLVIEWNSAGSTEARIKLQSAMGLEDGLPQLIARMQSPSETLNSAIEGAKLLSNLMGLNKDRASGNPGEKFSIVIDLGEDKKLTFTKDITPAPDLEGGDSALSSNTEGEGEPPPLRVLDKRQAD